MKRILFLGGGRLNDLGPFEPNAEIVVPDEQAEQLIERGLAVPIPAQSSRAVTITIAIPGGDYV